ncbi:hypothetical protein [Microbacterium testaceum]|uniref:hypothetical protein n=1 Tax=Microbacterium testaceum TaxID=2033 RepID=UPI001D179453|nr:hypothetical protein [Microbacterium testaceum]MCC4250714.1 hypothetical protein [Microbacterium testaceum]
MITPDDLPEVDEDVARRIILAARSIAPCIDSFADESEQKKDALAVLRGVADEAPAKGSRRARAQRIGSASIDYWDANTWHAEDRALLRSLCVPATPLGLPRGSFPTERPVSSLWPEKYS